VKRNYLDTSKAKRVLGWQSETDLATGLEQVVNWFKTQKTGARTFP